MMNSICLFSFFFEPKNAKKINSESEKKTQNKLLKGGDVYKNKKRRDDLVCVGRDDSLRKKEKSSNSFLDF